MADNNLHEELNTMRIELTALLRANRLLRSAVQEVNRIDMVRAALILRSSISLIKYLRKLIHTACYPARCL